MTSTPLSNESSWVDISSSLDARSLTGSISSISQIPVSSSTTTTTTTGITTNFTEVKNVGLKCMEKLLLDASRDSVSVSCLSFSPRESEYDAGTGGGSQSISPISPSSPLMMLPEDGDEDPCLVPNHVSLVEAMLMNKEELLDRSRKISSDWLWDWSTVSPPSAGGGSNTNGDRKSHSSGQRLPSSASSSTSKEKDARGQVVQHKQKQHPSQLLLTDNQMDWRTFLEQQAAQKKLSLRQWATRRGFFSKEVLSIFLLSNILSLILGAGIGYTVLIRRSL